MLARRSRSATSLFATGRRRTAAPLNFVQALTESCDTWFYQVGIKIGADPIMDWALRLGFGAKCGIPLRGEVEGRIPTDQYMKATHGRKILNGDIANLSIGQGDTESTPLQVAQAMAIIGNGGTFYQTRLVQQVQTVDNEIVTAFQVREKKTLERFARHDGAVAGGTDQCSERPRRAPPIRRVLESVAVAGKTGTAQWGPKNKERTAAWFAGFVPAEQTAVCVRRASTKAMSAPMSTADPRRADDRHDLEGNLQREGKRNKRPDAGTG